MIWKINFTSTADKNNLSESQLSKIFNCFKNEKYQNFINKTIERDKQYDEFPVAKWQLQKSRELEELFHSNINYDIDNNIVNVKVSFVVDFPKDWDKSDIINWTEGFNRLNKVFLMTQMDEIIANKNIKDFDVDRNENKFLEKLIENEKIDLEKI